MMFIRRAWWVPILLLLLSACGSPEWLDQHGNSVKRDALNGHRVVVNYWAQWCAPCRAELPELNRLSKDFPEARIIGIDFDGATGDALLAASEEMGIEFAVLGQDFAADLGLEKPKVLPTTYILEEQGEVLQTLHGPQSYEDIAALLK